MTFIIPVSAPADKEPVTADEALCKIFPTYRGRYNGIYIFPTYRGRYNGIYINVLWLLDCTAVVGAVFAVMFWMTVEETPAEKTKCVTMVTTERRFLTSSMKTKGFSLKKVSD